MVIPKVLGAGLMLGLLLQGARAEHYEIFIVAGQSNACGRAEVTQRMPLEAGVEIPFWYEIDPEYGADFPRTRSGGWVPLAPQARGESKRYFIGPELGLGRVLGEPGAVRGRPAIFKFARGGSALGKDWLSPEGPQLYGKMRRAFFGEALPALLKRGDTWRVAGIFWLQGEAEAGEEAAANAYLQVLQDFKRLVRRDFRNPSMVWVIGRISWPKAGYQELVRTAQRAVVQNDLRAIWVDADDLPRNSAQDDHFNADGQLELGRRMGLAYQYLQEWEAGPE